MSAPGPSQALRAIFAARWDAPLLVDGLSGDTWTYGGARRAAAGLAAAWKRRSGRETGRVAMLLPNSPEYALGYLAALLHGWTVVPVNPLLGRRDAAYIVEQTSPDLLLHSAALPPWADGGGAPESLGVPAVELGEVAGPLRACAGPGGGGTPEAPPLPDPGATLSIHYTSGTTGRPKGVVHTVGSILSSAAAFNTLVGLAPGCRSLHVFPMAYMAGFLNTLVCPMLAGGAAVLAPAFDAKLALRFWEIPERHGVDVLWLAPSMCGTILALDRDHAAAPARGRRIAAAIACTAPLPEAIREKFAQRYGIRLLESYGLSETLFVSANAPSHPLRTGSVGRLLDGVAVEVRDAGGSPLPAGGEGDLFVKSPFTMRGYHDPASPPASPAPPPPWFDSGDIGLLDADGFLFITGRKKDLIIRGGYNVSPRAVEEILLECPGVAEAAVVGLPHPLKGEEIVAVVRREDGGTGVDPAVERHCALRLPAHSRPDRLLAVDRFPAGISGKIQKNVLRQRLLDQDAGAAAPPSAHAP